MGFCSYAFDGAGISFLPGISPKSQSCREAERMTALVSPSMMAVTNLVAIAVGQEARCPPLSAPIPVHLKRSVGSKHGIQRGDEC